MEQLAEHAPDGHECHEPHPILDTPHPVAHLLGVGPEAAGSAEAGGRGGAAELNGGLVVSRQLRLTPTSSGP